MNLSLVPAFFYNAYVVCCDVRTESSTCLCGDACGFSNRCNVNEYVDALPIGLEQKAYGFIPHFLTRLADRHQLVPRLCLGTH